MAENCLIVGAGPTGLTLAIELRRFGLPVRLIDKSPHAAPWSQALVVQARTLEQFARYGIAAEAIARGRKIREAHFWSDGKPIASLAFDRIPGAFPYVLFLPQNETEALLTEHLRSLGTEIERETELTGFENASDNSGVTATLRPAGGQQEITRFRWLAGCDGAHSTVRAGMRVPFEGDTVGLRFSLGDLRLTGDDVPGDELDIYLHRGGDVLFIARLKDNLHRVILALHEQQSGEPRVPELEDFNAAFQRYALKIKADAATWMAPFHVNQRKAARYRLGSVFLAGDASHIHSPVGGQGMNTGIQDAANLAWKLAAVSQATAGHPLDSDNLLDSYNDERGKVGDALLRDTSRGLRAATASNPLVEHLRDFVIHQATRLEAVQDAMAKAISETSIQYRGSSLVLDAAHSGPLRAGDRMPDAVRHETGETLLAALQEAKHLLIAIDLPSEQVPRDFRNTAILALDSSAAGWTPPLLELLGSGPRMYFVRPDGYIGFHGTGGGEPLRQYARGVGLL